MTFGIEMNRTIFYEMIRDGGKMTQTNVFTGHTDNQPTRDKGSYLKTQRKITDEQIVIIRKGTSPLLGRVFFFI